MLWYNSPATNWSEALPIGNGRLGAMVYGRSTTELLQLNENSVWYGGPQDRIPKNALRNLPKLRELIREGRQREAEALVRASFFASPSSQRHYEPLGTLYLDFGHEEGSIDNYFRELDIEDAMSRTTYTHDGVHHSREVIASYPDQVIAMRVVSSQLSTFTIRLNRISDREGETTKFLDSLTAKDGKIIMHATPGGRNSNRLCCVVSASTDDLHGSIQSVGDSLVVTASTTLILLAAQTTFRVEDPESAALFDIRKCCFWEDILQRHRADYWELYQRVSLRLYPNDRSLDIPTNELLRESPDPGLVALYYDYGRYLLISSSRDGEKALPATSQGIWNPSFHSTCGSKYTVNINLQMNYWLANTSNLPECEMPLFKHIERMVDNGMETATKMYGCKGWCAHHNTDIWANTDPQDTQMSATLWPLGGAWLCTHIWERYLFFEDRQFLMELYPALEGCVRFLLDYLIEDKTGQFLVTNPSLSPENAFKNPRGEQGTFCESSTMDVQILTSVLDAYILATDVLQSIPRSNSVSLEDVLDALCRLPCVAVSSEGLIQEWGQNAYEEVEPGHRRISHLWGLHPGSIITPTATPNLARAASAVLSRRATNGSGHTGWSRAWLVNFHARIGEAEKCKEHLELLLQKSTFPNLLDNHLPFQIDGNLGGSAGIIEMIVQSHEVDSGDGTITIRLLPAWPKEWKGGGIKGVRVRGGSAVSFEWEDGKIKGKVGIECDLDTTQYHLVFPDGSQVEFWGKGKHSFP
ncbi:hypothetical protein DRE_03706 [Drechslerella stenobrocha 248]|uniref:Uncharacterized protein n=1 Tax=Drechslerella stenobrocha 248 TaxID=1043628 RepID=W7HU04_9PEZI|nr:hypothetical protein DRE_03706 [Drechslerella stenobrocha 248]